MNTLLHALRAGLRPRPSVGLRACLREAHPAAGLGLLAAGLAALAVAGPAIAAEAQAPRVAASQPAPRYPEPLVRHLVTQDRSVRIQEQQVRGATTSIEVQPLHGGAAYSITPPAPTPPGPGSEQGRMQWRIGTFR